MNHSICVALWNDPKTFKTENTFAADCKPTSTMPMSFTFDLPKGTYAALCFRDEDGDHAFDRGHEEHDFITLPEQKLGLLNLSPDFDEIAFELPSGGTAITWTLD